MWSIFIEVMIYVENYLEHSKLSKIMERDHCIFFSSKILISFLFAPKGQSQHGEPMSI